MKKLAIIITHPIQYYTPLFQLLAKSCELKVFYTWGTNAEKAKYDPDFKKEIFWDLPLLDGYSYEFQTNTAPNPGSHHFSGIKNPTLINKIKDFSPTAILIYGWAYQSHLKVLRKFKGEIPIWFRGDSNLIDRQKGIKSVLRGLTLKWVYRNVDKAFYVGSANKSYFEAFGLKEKQLVFAPHSVDNDRFAKDRNQEVSELRQKFNIATNEILILFAGKVEAKKNPDLLLKVFIELSLKGVHLLFVGNGHLEKSLKSQVSNLKSQKIHFMDFQNQTQMPVVYQACNLFVLPSQGPSETWGLAVNEAMAAGRAILISDKVGCSTDLVKSGINGDIFISGDLQDFKRKLQVLLTDRDKLIRMGEESSKIIKSWSVENQANWILKVLNEGY